MLLNVYFLKLKGGLRYTDRLRLFENKKRKFLWDGDLQK